LAHSIDLISLLEILRLSEKKIRQQNTEMQSYKPIFFNYRKQYIFFLTLISLSSSSSPLFNLLLVGALVCLQHRLTLNSSPASETSKEKRKKEKRKRKKTHLRFTPLSLPPLADRLPPSPPSNFHQIIRAFWKERKVSNNERTHGSRRNTKGGHKDERTEGWTFYFSARELTHSSHLPNNIKKCTELLWTIKCKQASKITHMHICKKEKERGKP